MTSFGTMLGPEDEGGLERAQQAAIRRALMPSMLMAISMGKETFKWKKEEMQRFLAPFLEPDAMPRLKEKIDNAYAASTSTAVP